MPTRSSSLNRIDAALALLANYDNIATVAENIDAVIAASGLNLDELQALVDAIESAVGAVSADLSTTDITTTTVTIASSLGTDAIIPAATSTTAGVATADMVSKLNSIASGATANSSDATLLSRANHTGTQTASTISDLTETVQGIVESQITADSYLLSRANHTGTQTAATISDFWESATVAVADALIAGTGISIEPTFDPYAQSYYVTISSTSTGVTNLSYTSSSTTGTVVSSTGTGAIIPAATTSAAGLFTAADKARLDGLANVAISGSYNDLLDTPSLVGSSGIIVSDTEPSNPAVGTLWVDSSVEQTWEPGFGYQNNTMGSSGIAGLGGEYLFRYTENYGWVITGNVYQVATTNYVYPNLEATGAWADALTGVATGITVTYNGVVAGSTTITLKAFDINNNLLGSVVQSISVGPALADKVVVIPLTWSGARLKSVNLELSGSYSVPIFIRSLVVA